MSPDALAEKVRAIGRGDGFEVAFNGYSEAGESVAAYAEAGATWWLENVHDRRGSPEEVLRLVGAGPPAR